MTKKVPYINIGAKINKNLKRDTKEAHQWEQSTSHYFTWVATQTVKMYAEKVQRVKNYTLRLLLQQNAQNQPDVLPS